MIRVLIADDSAVTREYLAYVVEQDPVLHVVASARNGLEAVTQAERLRPDVVLMDCHMPRMDGYEATRLIMERVPVPIVMMSASLSRDETALTFEALQAGAVTLIDKPQGPDHERHAETARRLVETIKLMADVKVVRRWPRRGDQAPTPAPAPSGKIRLVAIAASTGGPPVVAEILKALPAACAAPILLVQHIAAGFVEGLVEWLGQQTRLRVKLAESGEPARPGTVEVAPDGLQLGIDAQGVIRLTRQPGEDGFCPSASYLFQSVAQAYGPSALGVVLTGMGRDGAAGLRELRLAGGMTIVQDEETSVVFGMPGEALRLEAAQYVLPPDRIAATIRSLTVPG